ncbi:TrmB family transcriptional regulator [Shimazuella sp. AN120528]|uniref:TrmB family transcriptional regulator n=1 Tax=Shimazuella soli TaxID=1892854 RepID=UPI001F0F0F1C|nr:helix-turn-helix domain-containing protein [Shimazuella soli]MCH5584233.1 TrmB family transcriptional regulator [Shimazuella soli]
MEDVLPILRSLGFSEMEGKCFVTLAQNKSLTGYEVAKKLGASRSNVYSSLQSLVDKGYVLSIKGETSNFKAISFEELQSKLRRNMDESLNKLETVFPEFLESYDDFFTLDSQKQILERIQFELSQAKEEILFDCWAEEVHWFRDLLIDGENRGLRVMGSVLGDVELPLKTVLIEPREDSWQQTLGRKFSVLIDRKVTILGVHHKKFATKALFTEHPGMANLLFNNFYHDVVIHEITKDFGTQLEQKYGRNFNKIIQKYFKGK